MAMARLSRARRTVMAEPDAVDKMLDFIEGLAVAEILSETVEFINV